MRIEIFPPLSIIEQGKRQNQEDAVAQWNSRLFVLCDGMGGHEKGEVASQCVSQSFVRWFDENINPDEPFTDEILFEALEYAYRELDSHSDASARQMGTTLTLLYIHSAGVTAMHIGDSRIYHIRPSQGLKYQSRDHSLAFELFQAGEITYREFLNYPSKNIVTRAMTPGEDGRMRPDIIHINDIEPDDWFYMCSDGMLEQTDNDGIFRLFSSDATDEEKRQQLIAATAGNQDNHSAWLIHIKDVVREETDYQPLDEESTSRCNALNIIALHGSQYDDDVTIVERTTKVKTMLQKMKTIVDFITNKKN